MPTDPTPTTPHAGGSFLDLADQQGGFEKPPDGLDQETCPKCGGETMQSYGLMGGGCGTSVFCAGDPGCDWFYKEQDKDSGKDTSEVAP